MIYGQPVNLTASGTVTPRGRIVGFYVNSTTAGTLVITCNGTAASGTITPAIGWHFFPVESAGPLTVTIGGTLNVTFIVQPL